MNWFAWWLKYVRGLRIGHPKHYTTFPATGTYAYTGQSATLTYTPAIDNTPNQFTFADVTNQPLNTAIISAQVTISGLGSGITITLNASGGTIDKNGDGNFLGSQIVGNGDTVRARVTSSGSNNTAVNCVVVASPSGVQDTFSATTLAGASFDYYISTTGNDANSGSLASPWAITSLKVGSANFSKIPGKRIGLLPGSYSVGAYCQPSSSVGALQIPGGSSGSPTVIASCDSSGNYSARTATISGLNGGVYGGFAGHSYNGPLVSHCGTYPSSYPVGYLTIDGIIFTGYSYKGVRIGGASSGDGASGLRGIIVKNCEFTGGNHNVGDTTDNSDPLWLDYTIGALVQNNYFHDNYGTGGTSTADHIEGMICWGCQGTTIEFNTLVNTGSIYGKEDANQGSTIRYNYIDVSMYTDTGTPAGIQDFTGAATGGLTQTTKIHNNIIVSSGWGIRGATLSYAYGWTTPVEIYNNTIVLSSGAGPYPAIWATVESAGYGALKCFNNIYTGSADGSGYKSFVTNPRGPGIWDYNLYKGSGMTWDLRVDGSLSTVLNDYTTQSAFATAMASNSGISGADSHSVANNTPGFTGTGTLAQKYKLSGGAAAQGTGKSDGTSGGSACDMGAWGGASPPTQIGFAA